MSRIQPTSGPRQKSLAVAPWALDPITYDYRWLRCDQDGGSCAGISGATDSTYVLKSVDRGNTLRVRVTGTNSTGTDSATSVPTAVVKAGAPPTPAPPATGCPTTPGTLAVTAVSPPARLLIDQAQIQLSTVTFGTRAASVRFHVSACGGQPVQGALIYATAVPYGQFAIPNEQPTGSDGWATLDFHAQAGFPVSTKQQILVVFVRARKASDNLLGGISTRRLVSFRVSQ
ncbi:MAG: hypothetical protein ABI927_01465 [Gaiellaceae bacterium]